jgi:hypothetical protein
MNDWRLALAAQSTPSRPRPCMKRSAPAPKKEEVIGSHQLEEHVLVCLSKLNINKLSPRELSGLKNSHRQPPNYCHV